MTISDTTMNASPSIADVVVVGAGAAGLTAAITAAAAGKKVVVLEKSAYVGGTSAWSGGVAWVPDNHLMPAADVEDSVEQAKRYLHSVIGNDLDHDKIDAFLQNCRAAFEFLDKNTSAVRLMSYAGVDYYPDLAGATSHRGLMVQPFDGRELGEHLADLQYPLRQLAVFESMQVDVVDLHHLQNMLGSWKSLVHSARLIGRYVQDRIVWKRGTRLIRGNGLAARLYRSALDQGIAVVRNAPAVELIREGDRIAGVVYERDGKRVRVDARLGVILASGGVSASAHYRKMLMPAADAHVSMLPPGNCGDGVTMAIAEGALLGEGKPVNACMAPVSVLTRRDGSVVKYPHLAFDRCKPGSVMIDRRGQRFTNESGSYHDVGKAMQSPDAIPAWLIADAPFLRRYGMGLARPFPYPVKPMVESGYLVEAPTLGDLARKTGIDVQGLEETVARINDYAKTGVDPEFGRGGNAYNRSLGDATHVPNPCLGQIGQAPFYAVRLHPGDIGTFVGLQVNANAQVIDARKHPIAGLYACGLDINTIFNGTYPGAGCTHGPNITFAYVAARHLTQATERPDRNDSRTAVSDDVADLKELSQ